MELTIDMAVIVLIAGVLTVAIATVVEVCAALAADREEYRD